jgi:hypothetical protein
VPPRSSSPSTTAAERARAQLLHRPGGIDVVAHLLAVNAQDARMLPHALAARGGSAEGCVITWLMRSTLHLVRAEDVRWLLALTGPRQQAGNARRLKQLGIAPATDAIARLLADGPLPRAEIAARLDAPTDGQRIVHLLHRAALDGAIAMTPGREWALLDELAPAAGGGRRDRGGAASADPVAALGARYRASRPGAGPPDLARWSGLPLSLARAALADAPEPRPRRGELGTTFIPAFDELLLSWVDRSPTIPPEHERAVFPGGGVLRPVILEDGVATGTWRLRGGEVIAEPFA